MKLIIDGYNLLKNIEGVEFISPSRTADYQRCLAFYLMRKKLEGLLVFDGGITPFQEHAHHKKLDIVYVGRGKTADAFIKGYLDLESKSDLLLVSSDRELNRYAQAYGVCSIDVRIFWQFVLQATIVAGKKIKTMNSDIPKMTDTENRELDSLMFGVSEKELNVKHDIVNVHDRQSSGQTQSKIDKKLVLKMKKL